ncbi:MAG: acyl-CoA reductase [Candidatus Xenobia bacterium]
MSRYEHYLFGEFISSETPLTRADAERIVAQGREASVRLAQVPIRRILDVLDATARSWLDPTNRWRRAAEEHMPTVVGFHPTMVVHALEALAGNMLRPSLEKRLRIELGGRDYLDRWRYHSSSRGYVRAFPVGVVFHVSPGNVFVGGADSLMCGILTKNANIMKVPFDDPVFPLLFVRSLQDHDPDGEVAKSLALVHFPGGSDELEDVFATQCDGLVVWGGESAVEAYRRSTPAHIRLAIYGPRYSFSLFTLRGLAQTDLAVACRAAATDIAMWEQRACSSPQIFLLQDEAGLERFCDVLAEQLTNVAQELPQARLGVDEQVDILRARELAAMAEVKGTARLLHPPDTSWTIIAERSGPLPQGPLNRVIYVRTWTDLDEVAHLLEPMRSHLQSVGLLVGSGELEPMATWLARYGVTRLTRVGEMGVGKVGTPHDGTWQLQDLVRWIAIESPAERFDLGQRLTPENSLSRLEKLQRLAVYARDHSPFYKDRLGDLGLSDPSDIRRVPFLDRQHIYENTPPVGTGLLTGPLEKAYVFASGGSTGAPKFSFYSYDEFDNVTSILAEIYQVAAIEPKDVVGNLFMAGNLWTSFLVANEALEKIGCVTLPIAGNADVDLILRYMQLFQPTALIGLPSIIIQVAEEIERRGLGLKVSKILYGGEHLGRQAQAMLRRTIGAEHIMSAGYASVDAGPIGYQCPEAEGAVHHLLYDHQYLEIIDPLTMENLPPGQDGEIVVTNMDRMLMPIIRYRTGDRGRRIKALCTCGRKTPLFELMGRCDDVVRVGSVSIYPDDIASALGQVPGVSALFQIVADRDGVKDRLTIRAEYTGALDGLQHKVRDALLAAHGELHEALREGWLGSLEVEMLPPGGLPRIRRTGKIKKVIDRR